MAPFMGGAPRDYAAQTGPTEPAPRFGVVPATVLKVSRRAVRISLSRLQAVRLECNAMAHVLPGPRHATFPVDRSSDCGSAHPRVHARRLSMTPAASSATRIASGDTGLSVRLAQRAFAALLEQADADVGTSFHAAQRRSAAWRTLSALSADDHAQLLRWLALQLASGATRVGAACRSLARVDALLAATVSAALFSARQELRLSVDVIDSERTLFKSAESISPPLAQRERFQSRAMTSGTSAPRHGTTR